MMKLLKKLIFPFLCLLTVAGCSSQKKPLNGWMELNGKLKILSTTAQIHDLASAIGGERVDAWVLVQGDLNPHSYELVKGDGEKVARADVVFYNGLGLEHGASLSSLLKSSPKATAVGEWISQRAPDRILKKSSVVDPHIWMDVSLWEMAIDPIAEELCKKDPSGADYYAKRAEALHRTMQAVDGEIFTLLQSIPQEKRYLVTSHDAFQYFTKRYLAEGQEANWMERFAAPEGLSPDGQLNPVDIQKTVSFLKERKISVVFPESNVNRDSIRKIISVAKEKGLDIQICSETLYGDSTSGLSYLESMRANAKVLSTYLGQ